MGQVRAGRVLEIVIVMRKEGEGGLSAGEKINFRAANREEKLHRGEHCVRLAADLMRL